MAIYQMPADLKLIHFIEIIIQWNSALKNVNNCLNTIVYSYLETYCGQSSSTYLNIV